MFNKIMFDDADDVFMTLDDYDVESTGYNILDEQFDGGIKPGDVLLVSASAGGGKTAMLMNLALNLAKQDCCVFHITMDYRPAVVQNRYLKIQGIHCVDEPERDAQYCTVNDNIHIIRVPPGSSMQDVWNEISCFESGLEDRGLSVVLLDHIDLIKAKEAPVRSDMYYDNLSNALDEFSIMCKSHHYIGLTACQQTRAEATGVVPVVFSINRQMLVTIPEFSLTIALDSVTNEAVLMVLKNKTQKPNSVVYLQFDSRTGKLSDTTKRHHGATDAQILDE